MKKKKFWLIPLIIILLLALGAGALIIWERIELKNAPEPGAEAEKYCGEIFSSFKEGLSSPALGGISLKAGEAESIDGQLLLQAYRESAGYELIGPAERDGRSARQKISISHADFSYIPQGMNEEINEKLSAAVAEAERASDIYNSDNTFKSEIVENFYAESLNSRLSELSSHKKSEEFTIELKYEDKLWQIVNTQELAAAVMGEAAEQSFDAEAEEIKAEALIKLDYVPLHYRIDEKALWGPAPRQENFLVSYDPAEIDALLAGDTAQKLIKGRELLWSSQTERIPDTPIRCYLDETLLVICWQQVEAQAVGTYSEIITADGSQLRRRIAGDFFEDANHKTTSEFAADCNAVLTLGGDFYHHGRNCGIVVYDRCVWRFEPHTCDCCYITGSGDMLFSYRDQFQTQEEAQSFVNDNDILYSLCFGPVLIDDGADVTPEQYMWGEIHDTYARSAIGMRGENHYITLNINCQKPNYYYLATLRDAADAMLRAGCVKAYTLDGGQTATTVFNGELINPVQFGWEKPISDVIYFATALPEE